jgi:hypothetical protein
LNTEQTSKFQNAFRLIPSIIGAASCWWMAITLFRAWQTPMAVEEGRWVHLGVGIMALEFILIHSGVLLPGFSMSKVTNEMGRQWIFLGSIVYLIFGAAIVFGFKSLMLLGIFAGIMIPRWISVVSDSDKMKMQQILRSFLCMGLFIGVGLLCLFVHFSRGGLTPEMLDRVYPNRGSGIWEQNPQQVLVGGVIYFSMAGMVEMIAAVRQRRANLSEQPQPFTKPSAYYTDHQSPPPRAEF